MDEITNLIENMSINDNRTKCLNAINSNDTSLMYEIAEDLHSNYILDYNIYPSEVQSNIYEVNRLVLKVLNNVNLADFTNLYHNICSVIDAVQNQNI